MKGACYNKAWPHIFSIWKLCVSYTTKAVAKMKWGHFVIHCNRLLNILIWAENLNNKKTRWCWKQGWETLNQVPYFCCCIFHLRGASSLHQVWVEIGKEECSRKFQQHFRHLHHVGATAWLWWGCWFHFFVFSQFIIWILQQNKCNICYDYDTYGVIMHGEGGGGGGMVTYLSPLFPIYKHYCRYCFL